MHESSRLIGKAAIDLYCPLGGSIVDIGAMNVNGSLRDVCHAAYTGVDIESGPGVDVVVPLGHELPFPNENFDMAVSSSTFEHDPIFWHTFLGMARVTKVDGYIYINAPSNGSYHAHPVDCWRFYPDACYALLAWARRSGFDLVLIESFIAPRMNDEWEDCVMVFRRGANAGDLTRRIWHGVAGAMHIRTTVNIQP